MRAPCKLTPRLGQVSAQQRIGQCACTRHLSTGVCSSVCMRAKFEWQHEVPEGAAHGPTDSLRGAPAVRRSA